MNDNWVVSTLENALSNWNDHLNEIWSLVSQTPESFRGGENWTVISGIHNALVGFGYGLLVLFFAMGVFRSAASFRELQRPEFALRHFIRFLLAKVAVGSSLELITAIYKICGGVVSTVMGGIGASISTTATLPEKIVEAIEDVSFLESMRSCFASQEQVSAVETAVDGREALEKLRTGKYDILLLDLIMPHVDGLGVLEQLKIVCPETAPAVIVVSAMRNESMVRRCCTLGAKYFMVKPVEPEALLKRAF